MAKYEHLPIFRKATELTVYLENAVRGFSRYQKYSIGERLRQTSWDLLMLIVRANNEDIDERFDLLSALREKGQEMRITLDIANELGAFPKKNAYPYSARLAVEINRQSEGWLKSVRGRSLPES